MATDIQIQVTNTEENITTTHPANMPKFNFCLPK